MLRVFAGTVTVEAGDKAKAGWSGAYSKNAPHNDQPGAPNNVRAGFGTNYAIAGGFRGLGFLKIGGLGVLSKPRKVACFFVCDVCK
jgi:hypothetical protein